MLSIIIPSRTEKFLNNTIQNVLDNATGEIEIFPVLDGYGDTPYEKIIDPRVKYISLPNNGQLQKRMGINAAVSISKGKYVMTLDAHCAVAEGFDEVLAKDCDDDWVVVPRRHRLEVEGWVSTSWEKPPIDYEYFMWQKITKDNRLSGYKWDVKTLARKDVLIDDIMTIQGSTWFMTRKWFDKMRFMKIAGYSGWGQEGEEIVMETWLRGGRVVVNKNTWYSHLHKGKRHGRMYHWRKRDIQVSYDYAYQYWVHDNKDWFINYINRFMPIPNWPENWQDKIYGHA